MEPIVGSLLFYAYIVGFCEITRQIIKATVKDGIFQVFLLELTSTLQLCACVFEGPVILKHFGMLGLWMNWFCLATIHGLTALNYGGSPLPVIEGTLSPDKLFRRTAKLQVAAIRIVAQVIAAYFTLRTVKLFWSLGLSPDHMAQHSSFVCKFQYKLPWIFIGATELVCVCCMKMATLELSSWNPGLSVRLTKSAIAATILSIGALLSGPTFMNPAQALGRFLACSGLELTDHLFLQWFCPSVGWLAGAFLFRHVRATISGKPPALAKKAKKVE